jgi:hypothetical protein
MWSQEPMGRHGAFSGRGGVGIPASWSYATTFTNRDAAILARYYYSPCLKIRDNRPAGPATAHSDPFRDCRIALYCSMDRLPCQAENI